MHTHLSAFATSTSVCGLLSPQFGLLEAGHVASTNHGRADRQRDMTLLMHGELLKAFLRGHQTFPTAYRHCRIRGSS
jgi:hypothetical protein